MAPPQKIEGSCGVDPVPARLCVLSGLDSFGLATIAAALAPRSASSTVSV
jgi:hypothetical protein